MERKLTLEELKKITSSKTLPLKPKPVKFPKSIKQYDRIYLSQEHTKKVLRMK